MPRDLRPRFNGAPTSRSGMASLHWPAASTAFALQRSPDLAVGDGGASSTRRSASTRFNGAPTSRSGMGRTRVRNYPVFSASTEPRPRGRGWAEGLGRAREHPALQRSPDLAVGDGSRSCSPSARSTGCFNGAPTSRSGMVARVRRRRDRLLASTEPRPRGRGWDEPDEQAPRVDPASTEPRPRGRGWGGDLETKALGWLLQRSPDLAVGDGGTEPVSPGRGVGFNGAPTSRSGMVVAILGDLHAVAASTEPRPRGRGWRVRVHMHWQYADASTEPRPRGRGWHGVAPLPVRNRRASTEPRPRGRGWGHGSRRDS